MKNILLTIEYDGSGFSGWQRQPGVRTVQGTLEQALSKVTGETVRINGTSRTDAGVHALGQRATFSGNFGIPAERIPLAVNNLLRGRGMKPGTDADVRIVRAEEKPLSFHARFASKGKKYRYIIRNERELPVFCRNYCCHVPEPLNVERMNRASEYVCGTHDFACFQAAGGTPGESTVRTIWNLQIEERYTESGRDVVIEVSGDGFLYNMVRILSGTLIEAGLGKRSPESLEEVIRSGDRRQAGFTAPPGGLYLVEVYYGGEDQQTFVG